MTTGIGLDPERQKKAKEYARLRRRLFVLDLGIAAAYTLGFLLTGFSLSIKALAMGLAPDPFSAAAVYFLIFFLGYSLLNLPLNYYSGFVLPHRYGLSTQTISGWIKDQIKSGILGLFLGGVVVEAIYFFLRLTPEWWWVVAAVFLWLFSGVLAALSPVLIIPLFWQLTPVPDQELVKRLKALAEKAGTRVAGVFTIDLSRRTTTANAALAGLGKTRRILLGDTLYKEYSPDEIETILAHELGHHVHGDIPKGILVQGLLTLGGLAIAHQVLAWGVNFFGFSGNSDIAGFPILALALGGFMVLTIPLGNTYSRWREGAADEYALQATHNPQAFAAAMTKLANQNLADADPEPWVEFLLYSHPPISRRLEHAQKFLGSMSTPAIPSPNT